MKKLISALIIAATTICAFAQKKPNIAVATFDTIGAFSLDEANIITELFISELGRSNDLKIVDRANFDKIMAEMKFQNTDWSDSEKTAKLGKALSADYIIRGQIMKMGDSIYLSSTILDIQTTQIIFSARERLSNLNEIYDKLESYCFQLSTNVPKPNYFIGEWITGGRQTNDGWGVIDAEYLNPFKDRMKKVTDDSLSRIIFYEDMSCKLFLSNAIKGIHGVYSYDYKNNKFIIESDDYSISGKMSLSSDKKALYILSSTERGISGPPRFTTIYSGFWKILIKAKDLNTSNERNETSAAKENAKEYKIGDEGEGGGIIFYVSQEGFLVYDGMGESKLCHYLEMSKSTLGISNWAPTLDTVNTFDGIGYGKSNTYKIVKSQKKSSLTKDNCAAYRCSLYSTEKTTAGDWFLPSKDELNLMYKTMNATVVSDASSSYFWSSSESTDNYIWIQHFSDGMQYDDNGKDYHNSVRAVRAF